MATSSAKQHNSEKLQKKFLQLRSNALKEGLSPEQLRQAVKGSSQTAAPSSKIKSLTETSWGGVQKLSAVLTDPDHRMHVLAAIAAVSVSLLLTTVYLNWGEITESPCIIDSNVITDEIYRPVVDCDMCRDVYGVPEERNLSAERFYQRYAFTGRPVLVKGATANWTAMNHFSFRFFRDLYQKTTGSLDTIEEDCQFFPYNTEFLTLAQALDMPEDRADFQPGQPSWSNCHDGVRMKLRKFYQRPYFLPPDSESAPEDWIFMGGPGVGAQVHLDYVERPSWQAQISGTKTWELIPSPECEAVCHSFNVTVEKGDIIVVDTNIWYHSTFVHPGEVSITIGAEYD
ncbi:uncharacterized protein LOC143288316 isoform X2 [Babylonia areolata]|uniref:uncharacterized protein LOC143288316 isoform X2 n=1 Tax=Babylonia areolata TaxID=304850 RepID=UPI003FD2A60F